MKIIWTGTDSLFLVKFPKQLKWTKIFYVILFRIFARISDLFVQNHYYCGELVKRNLELFSFKKPIKEFVDPVKYDQKYEKITHDSFNVLYYFPKKNSKFNVWLYGYDIFYQLRNIFNSVNFIVVDGDQDLSKLYPITDLLIRPNRHDGHPRMIDECIINDIPYIATKENPTLEYFSEKLIIAYYEQKKNNTQNNS